MTEAIALHVIVFHFAHALDPQRLPRQILAGAPAALAAGHAARFGRGARPLAPGMVAHRILAQRLELLRELPAHRHGERRSDADVLQAAVVIVEAEQQRTDRILAALVPAETGHDA